MEVNTLPVPQRDEVYRDLLEDPDLTIVDRSEGEVTPFSEIKKFPSHTSTGNLTGYGVEIKDPSHENGWRPVSTVSERYLLVNNRDVVEVAERIIDGTGFDKCPRKIFFDGRRFVYSIVLPNVTEMVDDDVISLGIQVRNSYDASMSFRALMYAERLVCMNGAVSKERFASHTFEHTMGNENWESEVEEAMSVLRSGPERLELFVQEMRRAKEYQIDAHELAHMRSGPMNSLPVSRWGEVVDAYLHDTSRRTAYDLLNATTQVLWHRDRAVSDLRYNEDCTDGILNYISTN